MFIKTTYSRLLFILLIARVNSQNTFIFYSMHCHNFNEASSMSCVNFFKFHFISLHSCQARCYYVNIVDSDKVNIDDDVTMQNLWYKNPITSGWHGKNKKTEVEVFMPELRFIQILLTIIH